jgi:hypothetical protein
VRRVLVTLVDLFYEDPWLFGAVVVGAGTAYVAGRASSGLGGLLLIVAVLAGLWASLRRAA